MAIKIIRGNATDSLFPSLFWKSRTSLLYECILYSLLWPLCQANAFLIKSQIKLVQSASISLPLARGQGQWCAEICLSSWTADGKVLCYCRACCSELKTTLQMNQKWIPSHSNSLCPNYLTIFIVNFYCQYWKWMNTVSAFLSQTQGFLFVYFFLKRINKLGQCD